jgi:uncharacterized protein YceH (UPF0502 family)
MSDLMPRPAQSQQQRWHPLPAVDRRVVGVLVEKAKTTPDGYPMSAGALRSGCNQKNNRYPLMELEREDVEESLARLRSAGAVAEVQGGGRVSRYRHYMYEWLGVEKLELAVMTELLLRGAQTEGELRGRAARMDPIPDLDALRPVLASLKAKGLVVALTPEGRGHVVTHALYESQELEKVRAEFSAGASTREVRANADPQRPSIAATAETAPRQPTSVSPFRAPNSAATSPASHAADAATADALASRQSVDVLRGELEEVRAELANLRKDLDDLWSHFR